MALKRAENESIFLQKKKVFFVCCYVYSFADLCSESFCFLEKFAVLGELAAEPKAWANFNAGRWMHNLSCSKVSTSLVVPPFVQWIHGVDSLSS